MNILIVEDDSYFGDILSRLVQEFGHDVTRAETGRAAVEKASSMDFDLFLLDVFLPDMTAMELIPQLRSIQANPRIITLTGQSTRELERQLRELGIAYYMAKPVPAAELKSILDHLAREKSEKATRRINSSPPRFHPETEKKRLKP